MLSFAQNAEDVLLWRVFSDIDPDTGFYVDIGANHPVVDSVTKHFYEAGWRGINVEPLRSHFELLQEQRPRDVNLHAAVGVQEGSLTFHHVLNNDGLSTLDQGMADGYRAQGMAVRSIEVPVVTLAQIFDEHVQGRPVHFLKIDVEAHEHEVIEGANWERDRPFVIVIEATHPEKWEDRLTSAAYHRVLDDGLNYVFVAEEHSDLAEDLKRPVTVADDFRPYEWTRRAHHYQRMLAVYAHDPLVDELLRRARRLATPAERTAAEELCSVLLSREDLIYAFVQDGRADFLALLNWALDVDPKVDDEIERLQAFRPGLESLRARVFAGLVSAPRSRARQALDSQLRRLRSLADRR